MGFRPVAQKVVTYDLPSVGNSISAHAAGAIAIHGDTEVFTGDTSIDLNAPLVRINGATPGFSPGPPTDFVGDGGPAMIPPAPDGYWPINGKLLPFYNVKGTGLITTGLEWAIDCEVADNLKPGNNDDPTVWLRDLVGMPTHDLAVTLAGNVNPPTVLDGWSKANGVTSLRYGPAGSYAANPSAFFEKGIAARSLCVWARYNAPTGQHGCIGKMDALGPAAPGYGIFWDGADLIEAGIYENIGAGRLVGANTVGAVTDTNFHYIVMTYDAALPTATCKLYLDGALAGTGTWTGTNLNSDGNGQPFGINTVAELGTARGWVKSAHLYNRELTAGEVAANFALGIHALPF